MTENIWAFTGFASGLARTVRAFNDWLEPIEIDAIADHICYKCASREEFENLRAQLEPESDYFFQSEHMGRRIALFKLKIEYTTKLGQIRFLELCDVKPGSSSSTGFDHIEIFPKDGDVFRLAMSMISVCPEMQRKPTKPGSTSNDVILELRLKSGLKIKLVSSSLLDKIKRVEMI